ncbi:MAG: hypothetical protein WAM11_12310 [Cyanobium sp.]
MLLIDTRLLPELRRQQRNPRGLPWIRNRFPRLPTDVTTPTPRTAEP